MEFGLDQLVSQLGSLYGQIATLVSLVAGAIVVFTLVVAVYRYFAGNQKVSALYDDALNAASISASVNLAVGLLGGALFNSGGTPHMLYGLLATLVALRYARK